MSETQDLLLPASPGDVDGQSSAKSEERPAVPPASTLETEGHVRGLSASVGIKGFPLPPQYTASLESMNLLGVSTEYRQGKG